MVVRIAVIGDHEATKECCCFMTTLDGSHLEGSFCDLRTCNLGEGYEDEKKKKGSS